MSSGSHYDEFTIITGSPYIGIVRPAPDLNAGAYKEGFYWFDSDFYADFLHCKSVIGIEAM